MSRLIIAIVRLTYLLRPLVFSMFAERTYVLPWAMEIGPRWFQRTVVALLPWKKLHRARDMIDAIEANSLEIFHEKQRALAAGDEAVVQQIGEGKDILSILSKILFQFDDKGLTISSEGKYECQHRGSLGGKRTDRPNVVCVLHFINGWVLDIVLAHLSLQQWTQPPALYAGLCGY